MTPERVKIVVDGRETEAPAGEILLHTLRRLGIAVPTLCHDDRLTPYGGCRLCVVARRDGQGGLVPACSTPVQRGMIVETSGAEVIESRRTQLQLITLNHRMECPVCERNGDCRLQDLLSEYGLPEERLPFTRVAAPRDEESPVIVRDPEKCIICGKCVRLCDEVQGVAAIGFVHRGIEARVSTLLERPLDCEFCGQCVNACPVGALVARPFVSEVPAWQREATTTTCSYCSCGCQITVESHGGTPQRVTADPAVLPNRGKLCVKGWLGWDLYDDPDRLERPLVRREGRLVEAGWEEALQTVVQALDRSRDEARAVVGLGSARLTCEDAYLMQRLIRSVIGSPHVDPGPVGGISALVEGMASTTGSPHSSATIADLAAADVVLVLRGDPTRTHPLVKTELVQGACQRDQQMILAHALSGGLERQATLHLAVEPGTEATLVHGLAAQVFARHHEKAEACGGLPGFSDWESSLRSYTLETVAAATGLQPEQIAEVSDRLARARNAVAVVVTGLGIPGDEAAVARAASQLMAFLAGSEGPTGVLVLGEKANVQGLLDVGLHPELLPGHRRVSEQERRTEVGGIWGEDPAPGPGWSTREISSRAARGEVGLLWVAGQDPVRAWPQGLCAREALEGAGFVVVQDAFLTDTARLADVVLPVRILGERDGTLVGADGLRRRLNRITVRRTTLPQDGDLFVEIARRLGSTLPTGEALEREMARLVSWPHGRSPVRYFRSVPRPVRRPAWSGMLLDASPQLYHSGSVTLRSRGLQQLSPTVAVRLSPADARELGVENGDTLRIASGEREILLRARLDRTVRRGTVVVPWQSSLGGSAAGLTSEIGPPLAVHVRASQ